MNFVYYGPAAQDPTLRSPSSRFATPNRKPFKGVDIKGANEVCLDAQAEQLQLYSTTRAHPFPIKEGQEAECRVVAPPLLRHNPYPLSNQLFASDQPLQLKTGTLPPTLPLKNSFDLPTAVYASTTPNW